MKNMVVPSVGESISEVTLAKWVKKEGDYVKRDEVICELESEKATFELNAEVAGILHLSAAEGDILQIGALVGTIDESAAAPAEETAPAAKQPTAAVPQPQNDVPAKQDTASDIKATPVAQAIITDKHVDTAALKGSGTGGKILKNDVINILSAPAQDQPAKPAERNENREKMSNLRRTVSRRLVEAKNSTAMLTTFNEVDMSSIMNIRKQFKDTFKQQFGINLGFMSFFARACSIALLDYPAVNAYIDGDSILFHNYCDISIAVSAPKGLVVPVIRNAETMSMAQLEQAVATLAGKARDNKLTPDEMAGGTFTITNGGVFGSLLSTPILNIPQSAILGMHKIQERPIAVDGKVEIRPMMYVALSYDHRIIDGRESVSFLVRVKELLENPALLLTGKDPVKTLLGI